MNFEKFRFQCDICKREIEVNTHTDARVVHKQSAEDDFFGNLYTFHVELDCGSAIHVNIIVVDGQGEYRGHKYSAIKMKSADNDSKRVGAIRLALNFGKSLSKVLSAALTGENMAFIGESPICNLWSALLSDCFSVSKYDVLNWTRSLDDIKEQIKPGIHESGTIFQFDDDIIKAARPLLPNTVFVNLRKQKVQHGRELAYASNFVQEMLAIPKSDDRALSTLVTTKMKWLQRLYNEIKDELSESVIETFACPIGNLSKTVLVKSLLDQVLQQNIAENLRARMSTDELEIVSAHLLREIPTLKQVLHI